MPAETLLDASGFRSLGGEVAAALGRYPNVAADPAYAAEYLRMLDLCWAARFGTAEDEDDGGGE